MKCAAQVSGPLLKTVAFILFCAVQAHPQVREIDRSKLPQTKTMQQIYTDLLPIDRYARTPVTAATWHYPVPKTDIESQFLLARWPGRVAVPPPDGGIPSPHRHRKWTDVSR